ncbi:DNA -binding domain-containing protein [Yersinia sp. LJYL362]|uniref:DNA -binding domain-containing protein n=1 Tax=Yersinia sp. LJYL362 TaxID=3402108 RepID=UPI003AB69CA6
MKRNIYNDFAWECLRRNPQYIRDWEFFMKNNHEKKEPSQGKSEFIQSELDLNAEHKWGLMKYISPYDSDPVNVFWSLKLSNRSVRVTLNNTGKIKGGYTWGDMSNQPGIEHKILRMHDDSLCVKIFNQNAYFQLFIESTTVLMEDSNLYIPFHLESDTFSKNIEILQSIVNHKIEVEAKKEEQYLGLLKTIDDRKKGFSHRDIASKIFGKELVNNEWSADSWVRAKIRYRIKKANKLINHGYLDFL